MLKACCAMRPKKLGLYRHIKGSLASVQARRTEHWTTCTVAASHQAAGTFQQRPGRASMGRPRWAAVKHGHDFWLMM